METKILVMYIGVASIRSEDIPDYINKISERIMPSTFEGEIIIIPVQTLDSRIECINPKYITDKGLIFEHATMMKNLQIELENQLKIIKKEKK